MSDNTMTLQQELDEIASYGPGPFYINQSVADAAIKRFGNLPSNLVLMAKLPRNTILFTSSPPAPDLMTFPKVKAQWKRERNGRRS